MSKESANGSFGWMVPALVSHKATLDCQLGQQASETWGGQSSPFQKHLPGSWPVAQTSPQGRSHLAAPEPADEGNGDGEWGREGEREEAEREASLPFTTKSQVIIQVINHLALLCSSEASHCSGRPPLQGKGLHNIGGSLGTLPEAIYHTLWIVTRLCKQQPPDAPTNVLFAGKVAINYSSAFPS